MLLSLNENTLAYQMGVRPALQLRDLRSVPLKGVIASLNNFMGMPNVYTVSGVGDTKSETPMGSPERDALMFYLLNHAVTLVRKRVHPYEPLGDYLPLVKTFHTELSMRASRMFYYLLMIVTRESRHEKKGAKMADVYSKYPPAMKEFHYACLGLGESAAVDLLRNSPPAVSLGVYTSFMADQFNKGAFGSSQFGGKAWGTIAKLLNDYVEGSLSAELMLDDAFALAHNNGPIFNKGMLYDHYTSDIYKILDVQRSGQIPQLVCEETLSSGKRITGYHATVGSAYQACEALLGEEMQGSVDWYKVEALGGKGVKKYPNEKKAQDAKNGIVAEKPKTVFVGSASSLIGALPAYANKDNFIEIYPNQYLEKTTR